jgi:hypothetical protein
MSIKYIILLICIIIATSFTTIFIMQNTENSKELERQKAADKHFLSGTFKKSPEIGW